MAIDVVLLYHRITGPGLGARVAPERFAAQLDVLDKWADVDVKGAAEPADPFRIPRNAVHDWAADEFERRLRSWLAPTASPAGGDGRHGRTIRSR